MINIKLDTFITKEMFTTLAGCILVVEAFTESIKMLIVNPSHVFTLWIAFLFSCLVSIIRFFFSETHTKEDIILCIVNVVIIFLGAVGTYQVLVKPIGNLIG